MNDANFNIIEISANVYSIEEMRDSGLINYKTYLIIDGNESILFEPNPLLSFQKTKEAIETLTQFKNIKYIVVSHPSNFLTEFEKAIGTENISVITDSKNKALMQHYGIGSNFYDIEKNNYELHTHNFSLIFIPTPYIASPNAFVTYLEHSKILFSSELFSSDVTTQQTAHNGSYATEDSFEAIQKFHANNIANQDILNYALEKISPFEIELVAPQHGLLVKKEYIKPLVEKLNSLDCGLHIDANYNKSLVKKNFELLKQKKKTKLKSLRCKTILNLQDKTIIVSTTKTDLLEANQAFFEMSGFENIEDFRKEHRCICDLFLHVEEKEYLQAHYEDKTWVEYILANPNEKKYALMKSSRGELITYEVSIKVLNIELETEYIAIFQDVSDFLEEVDILNILSRVKGLHFILIDEKQKILKHSDSLKKVFAGVHQDKSLKNYVSENDARTITKHLKESSQSPYEIVLQGEKEELPAIVQGYNGSVNNIFVTILILIDLGRVRQLEEESKEKDLMIFQQTKLAQMGEMVNMIAHQWRQPLNAISAASIKLDMQKNLGLLTDKSFEENNDFIQAECQKLSHVIDSFMNFTKPSSKEAFIVEESVKNVLEAVSYKANEFHVLISLENKELKTVHLNGDRTLFEQVVLNLVSNAIDAHSENNVSNKSIKVTIFDHSITVCDNAGGIDTEGQKKLFNPYFTTKEKGKGTGLGLYMSQRIMKEHFHGAIVYKAIENGSKFLLNFKIIEESFHE